MATRSVATVFGGSGFIGRYVVKRLAASGHVVRVAVRDTEAALFLKTAGAVGQIVPLYTSFDEPGTIARAVDGADMVVNLVGILAERRPGDFMRIQGEAPGHIGRLCAEARVGRLVHVSAIGADANSPSLYARSKAAGEAAIRQAFPSVTILRPSVVFGPEDQFFNRFAAMAKLLPFMPVIEGATRFQPVYAADVADAIYAALTRPDAPGLLYELGGPRVISFRNVLSYILKETRRPRPLLSIPPGLARLQAAVAERIPGKPFTRDQLLLLARDNVVAAGALTLADLGIRATPLELVVPDYLRRYRPGGRKRDTMATEAGPTQKGP